jgi:hypothetical protein
MQTLYSWLANHFARRSYILFLIVASLFLVCVPTTNGAAGLKRQATSPPALQSSLDQKWLQRAFSQIDESEYHLRWQPGKDGYQSPNRAHELRFTYFPDGFDAEPRSLKAGEGPWKISMRLKAYGRESALIDFCNDSLEATGNQGRADSGPVVVEYLNNKQGMRQNFIVHQAPQ